MHRARPRRLRHFDYIGYHRYFVTFCTERRRPHFVRDDVVAAVLTQFRRVAREHDVALAAYCFMPDHVHLLIEGSSANADARTFMTRARQASGFACRNELVGRLWQHAGYERVLRSEDGLLPVARYILENPVRAGLVKSPEEYGRSGSDLYTIEEILEAVGEWRAPH